MNNEQLIQNVIGRGVEVDKENWLPSNRQKMSRRRSTGIMKGGETSGLVSPKPKKRPRMRRQSLNKRVSFGVVDVRLYEKDDDWSGNHAETARSIDVGTVPFNDGSTRSPLSCVDEEAASPPSRTDGGKMSTPETQSLLRKLIDENDDDDEGQDMTMEMTVNHGKILSSNTMRDIINRPAVGYNLSQLLDAESDDEGAEREELTMDVTANISSILSKRSAPEVASGDLTMDFTTNHSVIVMGDGFDADQSFSGDDNTAPFNFIKITTSSPDRQEEETMEMTVNHSCIAPRPNSRSPPRIEGTIAAPAQIFNKDMTAPEREGPRPTSVSPRRTEEETMEMTVNHSNIVQKVITVSPACNEEETMEMTTNYSSIAPKAFVVALSPVSSEVETMEVTNNHSNIAPRGISLSPARDEEDTMEVTINHSNIVPRGISLSPAPDEYQTMEMTMNHSSITSKAAYIASSSPAPDQSIVAVDDDVIIEGSDVDDGGAAVLESESVVSGDDAAQTPTLADEAPDEQIPSHHQEQHPSPPASPQLDFTGDLTRCFQDELEGIIAGSFQNERTADISRFGQDLSTGEKKFARDCERILSNKEDMESMFGDDDLDDFLQAMTAEKLVPTKLDSRSPPAPQQPSPKTFEPASLEEFLSAVGVRFVDGCSGASGRKTLSFGWCPAGSDPISPSELLKLACVDVSELQQYKHSCGQLHKAVDEVAGEVKSWEDWINSQAPQVFQRFTQNGIVGLDQMLGRQKTFYKLQARLNWHTYRSRHTERVRVMLTERSRDLHNDLTQLERADKKIQSIMTDMAQGPSAKLDQLRVGVAEQACAIDSFVVERTQLTEERDALAQKLQQLETFSVHGELIVMDATLCIQMQNELEAIQRRMAFLKGTVDWRLEDCSARSLRVAFGADYAIVVMLSADKAAIVKLVTLSQVRNDSFSSALFAAAQQHIDPILSRCQALDGVPKMLHEVSIRLGRLRSLTNEIERLESSYVIVRSVVKDGSAFLAVTVSSFATMSSATLTFDLSASSYPSNLKLRASRILSGNVTDVQIAQLVRRASGFGALTRLCRNLHDLMSR